MTMTSSFSITPRLFAAALLGATLLLILAQPTVAQTDRPPSLVEHLRTELQSKDEMRRERALVDVIALSGCSETCTVNLQSIEERKLSFANETGTGAVVDFTSIIPDLLEVYKNGPADGHRLLALSALINVGDAETLERLIEDENSQSEKAKIATHRTLAAFYLAKYPDLTERALNTKSLSIEDVRRAEALRVRSMKKGNQ